MLRHWVRVGAAGDFRHTSLIFVYIVALTYTSHPSPYYQRASISYQLQPYSTPSIEHSSITTAPIFGQYFLWHFFLFPLLVYSLPATTLMMHHCLILDVLPSDIVYSLAHSAQLSLSPLSFHFVHPASIQRGGPFTMIFCAISSLKLFLATLIIFIIHHRWGRNTALDQPSELLFTFFSHWLLLYLIKLFFSCLPPSYCWLRYSGLHILSEPIYAPLIGPF